MTSRVVRGGKGKLPGALHSIIISCDNTGCDESVNDKQVMKDGGLKIMGWSTAAFSGRLHHYCPKHGH